MPKIPTYTATIDYKPARGDLESAAMPGQALARFGEAVGEFGGKLVEYQKAREKKSEAESRQAAYDTRLADVEDYVKSARAESERANGTARMMDALHRDIADFDSLDSQAEMERDWTKAFRIRDDIVGAIGDPDARAAVESDTAGIAGLHVALMRGGEVRRLSHDGRQDLDRNLALYGEIADNARHPLEFDEAMDLATGEIRRKAERGFLTAEDAANLEQTFYADVAERQVRRAIAADPQGTLASLEGGEDFATLPAGRRARLMDEAARAVQDQAVARTTAAAADRRALEIRLPGFVTALRDGHLPDDRDDRFSRDSLIATFGDQDGARRWRELEDARAFGQETIRIKWAPPDEIARLLENEPDADAPDGNPSAPSLLRQAVDRRYQQLWSKPADYVLANPRIAELHDALRQAGAQPKLPAALTAALQASGAPAPAAPLSDEDRYAATAAYANATLAEQERLGLPADRRQVLPAAQAQELVARILDGDTKAAADTLTDIIATWDDAAPTAFTDLSRHGLPGEYRLLASLTDPTARQTFAKVLAAQATEPGVLRGKAGDEAEAIDGMLLDTVTPALGGPGNTVLAMGPGTGRGARLPPLPWTRNPVPVFDDDGDPVMVWNPEHKQDEQIKIPDGVTLNYFAKAGLADKSGGWPLQLGRMLNFLWGGNWDLQRPGLQRNSSGGFVFLPQFRDVSTVAIGVYAAAADIPLNMILELQSIVAYGSAYGKNELISQDYAPLAERNARNTELGYYLYTSGKIKSK